MSTTQIVATPFVAAYGSQTNWTDQQRAVFQAHMSAWQKDEVVGVLLALFLGTFGAHHFYLRRTGLGIVYAIFSFTGIPTIVSLVESFFMPERVRQYNLGLAKYFADQLNTVAPAVADASTLCPACGAGSPAGPHFCARCGAQLGSR